MSGVTEKRIPVKLKELCTITSSKRIYAADYVDEGVPFVRGKEVVQRFSSLGKLNSELFISRTKFEIIKDRFGAPKSGDLLLTSVGTLGVPYLVTDDDEFYFKDGNLIWFRELKDLNGRFLYYWLQSHAGKAQLQKCTIGTSQPAYTIERLKEIDVPDFSLVKQGHIASILSAYDDLIENSRRRIQLLEQAARLLYKEWFVHLRFPGHEHTKIIDGVPEGWEKKPLAELLTLQRGFDLPVSKRKEGRFPIYASTGINGYHAEGKVKGPGVVTGRSGSLGKVMYVSCDFWPLNTTLWVKEFKLVGPHYAHHLLENMQLEQYNGGAAVPTLNRNDVHRVEVLSPPSMLLRIFEDQSHDIVKQIDALTNMNLKLAKARDLLLPKLMNGEMAV